MVKESSHARALPSVRLLQEEIAILGLPRLIVRTHM
jgi:hypothetical protein